MHVPNPWFYLWLPGPYWANEDTIMASKDPKMSQWGTAAIRKHVTLTIHQKLKQIMRLKSDESQRKVMPSYSIALLTIYNIKKGEGLITPVYGIKCKCERPSQATYNERD